MSTSSPHPEVLCNLALIGGRGCGKSSVAKRILRRNRNFNLFSMDALIRYEAEGASIPAIVEQRGWRGFRDLEFRVAEKLARFQSGCLVDCGGGVVVDLDAANEEIYSTRKIEAIRSHGLVIYLRRDPAYLLERIGSDPNRPGLSEHHSFLELMARREPWYCEAADLVLDCGTRSKNEIVDAVLEWFYEEQTLAPRSARSASA